MDSSTFSTCVFLNHFTFSYYLITVSTLYKTIICKTEWMTNCRFEADCVFGLIWIYTGCNCEGRFSCIKYNYVIISSDLSFSSLCIFIHHFPLYVFSFVMAILLIRCSSSMWCQNIFDFQSNMLSCGQYCGYSILIIDCIWTTY